VRRRSLAFMSRYFLRVEAARGHAVAVARELSRNRLPYALVGLYVSDRYCLRARRCRTTSSTAINTSPGPLH
jgi:uncharacterized protein (DUF2237 family)